MHTDANLPTSPYAPPAAPVAERAPPRRWDRVALLAGVLAIATFFSSFGYWLFWDLMPFGPLVPRAFVVSVTHWATLLLALAGVAAAVLALRKSPRARALPGLLVNGFIVAFYLLLRLS